MTQIQLAIVGLVSMHAGDNSTILKEKLQAFIQHETSDKKAAAIEGAGEPAAATA